VTISDQARDLVYGRRGGRWLPRNRNDGAVGMVIEGGQLVKRQCPTPLYFVCTFCRARWWGPPLDVERPCHVCGAKVEVDESKGWGER
jgi:hypothetical protein